MRLKGESSGIPLSSYEFALLCCVSMAEEGATSAELAQYMWSMAGLKVSVASLGQAVRRMEEKCYVTAVERDLSTWAERRGRAVVKAWILIGPGREALASHGHWFRRLWDVGVMAEVSVPSPIQEVK